MQNYAPVRANIKNCYGHEALLNHFTKTCKAVTLVLQNGDRYTGRVVAFDSYTISLELVNSEDKQTLIFFKHALSYFFSNER